MIVFTTGKKYHKSNGPYHSYSVRAAYFCVYRSRQRLPAVYRNNYGTKTALASVYAGDCST